MNIDIHGLLALSTESTKNAAAAAKSLLYPV